jgi:hypothetical protein
MALLGWTARNTLSKTELCPIPVVDTCMSLACVNLSLCDDACIVRIYTTF